MLMLLVALLALPDWFANAVLPSLINFALNPTVWGVVAGVVWLVWVSKSKYAATISAAAHTAFHVVEDMKAQGKLPSFLDKEAAALEKFVEILEHQGYKPTDAAVELAKLAWQSMNAQKNQQSAAITDAAKAAVEAARPS